MSDASVNNNSSGTLEAMVTGARQGDNNAFRWLYERYKDELFRTSISLCRDEFLAEEALQESFIKMHKKIHQLKDTARFAPWLYRVVINTTYSVIKRHRNDWKNLDDAHGISADQEPESKDTWQRLGEALEKLPKGYRNVFVLHYLQGITHERVAEILDISVGTSKSQYSRAIQKLRKILTAMGVRYETAG